MNHPVDFKQVRRILVAKLRHHGDVLLSSPVFSVLKNHFPHLKIDAYLYEETLPMLQGHPAIDRFLLYDKKWKKRGIFHRFAKEAALLRQIRHGGYDLVINLTEGDRGAVAAKISKAPFAVGFDPEGSGMMRKKACYTHLIRHTPKPRHTVEKQLDALRCLGLYPSPDERELFFHIPDKARQKMKSLLEEQGVKEGRFVQVHPVSRWMFKTVPVATLVQVLEHMHEKGETIVLTASPDPKEKEMNRKIQKAAPFCIDLSGQISLKQLGALIDMSHFLLSVDSVPLHIASACKTPTLAIFGPTCEQNWGPYRNPFAAVITKKIGCRPCYQPGCGGSGKSDCLETLSSKQIIQAYEHLKAKILTEVSGPSPLVFQ